MTITANVYLVWAIIVFGLFTMGAIVFFSVNFITDRIRQIVNQRGLDNKTEAQLGRLATAVRRYKEEYDSDINSPRTAQAQGRVFQVFDDLYDK